MVTLTAGIPSAAVDRLIEHYSPSLRPWLSGVEEIVTSAAARWGVRLAGFHDAGWTSVIGVGHLRSGQAVILKALPDFERYVQETAALRHWEGATVCKLLAADDSDQILLVEVVAARPGGAPRPDDHMRRVADALPDLHRTEAPLGGPVPKLTDYYCESVLPRIERRARLLGGVVGDRRVRRATALGDELCSQSARGAMLHADLYAENVLFDGARRAVFIDPHAKLGSPAFDWAFWCVYYLPSSGFEERVQLCRDRVPALFDEVLRWVATLAVDGALYYLDTADSTASAMLRILDSPVMGLGR